MKILFVFPNFNAPYCWSPSIQILSAVLKRNGHKTFLIHINDQHAFPNNSKEIVKKVKRINPDLIGFTGTSFDFPRINEIAGDIKKEFNTLVVLGGIHATIKPDDLRGSNFDAFCVGEGEKALLELANRLEEKKDYFDIGSFWFKKNGKIIRNKPMPVVKDLNELPFNDWDIMDTRNLLAKRDNRLSAMFSRGCPFECSYCVNQVLKKIKGRKNYTRCRSVDNVISEMKYLISRFKISLFNADDDLFMLNRDWVNEFTAKYKREIYKDYNIEYIIEGRVDLVDEDIIHRLKDSGCSQIRLGVETGDEWLRNHVLNKGISDRKIIDVFGLCRKHDLNTLAFFMLGIPHESKNSLNKTFEMIAKIQPYLVRPTFYVPIYGTPLYDYCEKNKMLKEKLPKNQFTESALKFGDLSDDEIHRYYVLLAWYVNLELGHRHYLEAINRFQVENKDKLRSNFDIILEMDKHLSERTDSLHYVFFKSNINYIQRVE